MEAAARPLRCSVLVAQRAGPEQVLLGGIAQGGSVVGLLYVGNQIYTTMAPPQKVQLVFVLLAVCGVVPLVLSLGPAVVPTVAVVPLLPPTCIANSPGGT